MARSLARPLVRPRELFEALQRPSESAQLRLVDATFVMPAVRRDPPPLSLISSHTTLLLSLSLSVEAQRVGRVLRPAAAGRALLRH